MEAAWAEAWRCEGLGRSQRHQDIDKEENWKEGEGERMEEHGEAEKKRNEQQ